jgi:cell division protein FtsB
MEWIQTIRKWLIDGMLLSTFSVLCYALVFAPNGFILYWQVLRLRGAQADHLQMLRDEQALIHLNKQLLETDDEFFDKQARIVWGYVKSKERFYWYKDMESANEMDEYE